MVPIAAFNQHVRGMPHKTNSSHRDHYRGAPGKQADLATWNNLHPYGNQFNPERGTQYGSTHNGKEIQPTQAWPNNDPRLITSKGKFSTEYKSNMVNMLGDELNADNYCTCYSKRRHSARGKLERECS